MTVPVLRGVSLADWNDIDHLLGRRDELLDWLGVAGTAVRLAIIRARLVELSASPGHQPTPDGQPRPVLRVLHGAEE